MVWTGSVTDSADTAMDSEGNAEADNLKVKFNFSLFWVSLSAVFPTRRNRAQGSLGTAGDKHKVQFNFRF
jgi:hypothetical protein